MDDAVCAFACDSVPVMHIAPIDKIVLNLGVISWDIVRKICTMSTKKPPKSAVSICPKR